MRSLIKFIDQKGFSVYILLLSDAFWYFVSFLLSYYLRNNLATPIQGLAIYLRVVPYVLLLLIIVFHINGLYQKRNRISHISEIFLISKSLTICLVLIMAGSFLQKYDYSRALVILFWVFSLFFINFGRFLVRIIKQYLVQKGHGVVNVLIIGSGKAGKRLAQNLEKYRSFGYRICGFLDDRSKQKYNNYPNFGSTNELLSVIKNHKIQEVYISDPALSHDRILSLIHQCESLPVKFKVVSDLFEIIAGTIDINEIEGIPSLDLQTKSFSHPYHFFKRIIDVLGATLGIIILLPFWITIIIAIKLNSAGPAFFLQQRIGLNGQKFIMYKFRTMYIDSPKEQFAPRDRRDQRITPVGRFLRRFSLDETPQLINVFFGFMSLVGPRPEMPFIVAKYKDWQKKRLEVKPGLTGLWQILGRKDLPLLDNLEYDFYYIKNQSLLLDLIIIIKTLIVIITGKGAY